MCHGRHLHHPSATARRPVQDDVTRDPALRASDREREDTATLLREHAAAGRLDVDELDERTGAAYAARTRGDLDALLRDLPGRLRRSTPAPSTEHGGHGWSVFIPVAILLIVIWAVTGAGAPWPLWVIGFWGLPLLLKAGPPRRRGRAAWD